MPTRRREHSRRGEDCDEEGRVWTATEELGRFSRPPQEMGSLRRRAFTRLRTNPCSHTSAKNPRVEEFAGPIKSNGGPGTPGRRPLAR
jgi:hypothetical protein